MAQSDMGVSPASPRKKLIEVALPLDAINAASAREKSIRHGHPSTLHLWWARRPLAAARAVIFAQMVDDPSAWPELFPTEEEQTAERERLFSLIRELVKWENITNEEVLERARREIRENWRRGRSHFGICTGGGGRVLYLRSMTRSRAAARCRWRPSVLAWRRMPAI